LHEKKEEERVMVSPYLWYPYKKNWRENFPFSPTEMKTKENANIDFKACKMIILIRSFN
jgi:hypothetical protein